MRSVGRAGRHGTRHESPRGNPAGPPRNSAGPRPSLADPQHNAPQPGPDGPRPNLADPQHNAPQPHPAGAQRHLACPQPDPASAQRNPACPQPDPAGPHRRPAGPRRSAGLRAGGLLPAWSRVLVVVAHPDDESFGLGAVVDRQAADGAAVHMLCYTRGEASTLNETSTDLDRAREDELRRASTELGAATVTLLSYPDGHLAGIRTIDLAAHVAHLITRHRPEGLLVFDDTGITGHPDHRAATGAAVWAAAGAGLPVLAWALPVAVADRLQAETGLTFAGQPPDRIDLCVRVDRARQRRAALMHASQISPTAVLWRRLQLQGDCEHLRWLRPPQAISAQR